MRVLHWLLVAIGVTLRVLRGFHEAMGRVRGVLLHPPNLHRCQTEIAV